MVAQTIESLPVNVFVLRVVLISHRTEGNGFGCSIVPCKGCRVLVLPIGSTMDFESHIIERRGIHLARRLPLQGSGSFYKRQVCCCVEFEHNKNPTLLVGFVDALHGSMC